jgi:hypothetical protein
MTYTALVSSLGYCCMTDVKIATFTHASRALKSSWPARCSTVVASDNSLRTGLRMYKVRWRAHLEFLFTTTAQLNPSRTASPRTLQSSISSFSKRFHHAVPHLSCLDHRPGLRRRHLPYHWLRLQWLQSLLRWHSREQLL